jgi:HK97 family phage prohead protease
VNRRPDDITYAQLPVATLQTLADSDAAAGTFDAAVTTFNTRVQGLFYDQRLRDGCFDDSIAEGFPACVWSHDWDTPPIGACESIAQNGDDLLARTRLFVEGDDDSPVARQVYTAMRAVGGDGRNVLREFSIGFRVVDAEWAVEEEEEILDITQARLHEYGPCLVGRNTNRLIGVQSVAGPGARFASPLDPADDPILHRFPRARRVSDEQARRRRELLLTTRGR